MCENHTLIKLNENKKIIEDIENLLFDIKKPDQKDEGIIINNLFEIIQCFIENCDQHTSYNLMISLQNFKKFLEIYV